VNFFAYPYFNPAAGRDFGGAELQLYLMAAELAKDPRFHVSFIVRSEALAKPEVREGVELLPWSPPAAGLPVVRGLRRLLAFRRLLDAADADIIVQRCAGTLTGALALHCRSRGRGFAYMAAHDSDLLPERPVWWGRGLRPALRWAFYRLGLRRADLVFVQHEGQRELLARHHGREGAVRPCVQRVPDAAPREGGEFVLWVARCERWKQPGLFLDLARACPGERFVMVCPPAQSEPAFVAEIRDAARALPNLEFLDGVPYPEIDGLFRRASLLVNTSRSEGFPNTFVQAWKHGTPVLSLAVDPDGAIERHALGACCHGDAAALPGALAALLGDRDRWRACSANAAAWARAHHDVAARIEVDKRLLLGVRKGRPGLTRGQMAAPHGGPAAGGRR
jgi:glycosyltransferase involved in cell wall biosynthesis